MFCHSSLLMACLFQWLTPIFSKSSSTSANQHFRGRPLFRFPGKVSRKSYKKNKTKKKCIFNMLPALPQIPTLGNF
uniref:Secreted protein n=1 Tax=Pristhesancus plagipennis TaxID=1955184 RepID=A0A2K8JV82_PRIPG|nr:secreted hypothetical protein [Pristhesancus plagipennis]